MLNTILRKLSNHRTKMNESCSSAPRSEVRKVDEKTLRGISGGFDIQPIVTRFDPSRYGL